MTIKELKNILNKCSDENAYVSFSVGEPTEDDSSVDLDLDCIQIESDIIFLNFTVDKESDPERAEFVLHDILNHLDEKYPTKEKPDILIF